MDSRERERQAIVELETLHECQVRAGMPAQFAVCSVCKKPIPMGMKYFVCSVSTCNSGRLKLTFCSVRCWDIHLPEARHRDAGAIEKIARTSDSR